MDDLAVRHVPAVVALAIELHRPPADENAAVVRKEAARPLGDRRVALRVEDVQVGLIGLVAALFGRVVVGIHVAGGESAIQEDIEVLARVVFEGEAVGVGGRYC